MSEAQRLADESMNLVDRRLESDGYEWSVDADVQLRETAAELRRLAPMEAEWAALSQDAGKAEGEIDRLRAELQRTREELAALKSALGASCDDERQQLWEASSGGGCSRALDAERELAALRASLSEPVFWFRPVDHGAMYEGPVHHNSVGGRMLREEKPGEWVPLFAIKDTK